MTYSQFSGSSRGPENHAASDRFVCRFVDHDEAARRPASVVRVEEERLGRAQRDPADLVHGELLRRLVSVQ